MSLEQRLAGLFGHGLSFAFIFLFVGQLLRPMLWLGIAALLLAPWAGAVLVWREPETTQATRLSIVLAFLGVVAALILGLLLRR
ncbi:MAG: hypothetical protein ACK41E_05440 [Deinococcales bacterium]